MRFASLIVACSVFASAATSSYITEAAKWRTEYEASLKAPDGWLSVAGLFWLHEGRNTLGSDPKSDIVLPQSAPRQAATLYLRGGKVFRDQQTKPLVTDVNTHPDVIKTGDLSLMVIERGDPGEKKLGIRVRDPNAPARRGFTGCKWFPPDTHWRIEAKWIPAAQPKKMTITNVLGMKSEEPVPGLAEFTVNGKIFHLEPIVEDNDLFFMFRDTTTGKSTYGAGRFLYSDMPKNGKVELDFNQAHNPPCAFTAYATCPLPPPQNTLSIAVEAGEKKYGEN